MLSNRHIYTGSKGVQQLWEELEIERAINHFTISLVNQTTVEAVLWDVAKNCIARLGFLDCVVYLLDKERNMLVQKAAHGPKNPAPFEIACPIEIPLGKGIVGSVALRGKGEIIADTTQDSRYIMDDQLRFSEIAVPIISEGEVIGVIDAEHPEKNFFKPRHLTILTSIARVCAHKIKRVELAETLRQTERQLIETQKRMAETKLLALRMQFNPHFIFNSLSSINHFILGQHTHEASSFLTKFSRLLRQLLDNSENEWVTLDNELKVLALYLNLEQIRLQHSFTWNIHIDEQVPQNMLLIPPFILQPYVENAIWQRLLPGKIQPGHLHIACSIDQEILVIEMKDNGNLAEAEEVLSQTHIKHTYQGMNISQERLRLVNQLYDTDAEIHLQKVYYPQGTLAGTSVIFTMKQPTL